MIKINRPNTNRNTSKREITYQSQLKKEMKPKRIMHADEDEDGGLIKMADTKAP